MNSPLESTVLFQLGPVPITQAVLTTWVIMAVLVLGAVLLTRRLDLRPTRRQAALELVTVPKVLRLARTQVTVQTFEIGQYDDLLATTYT